MRIVGNIVPFIGFAIAPCDGSGVPAMDSDEIEAARHETKVMMFVWFGRVMAFPIGNVMPRLVDPSNPRQYAPGDL